MRTAYRVLQEKYVSILTEDTYPEWKEKHFATVAPKWNKLLDIAFNPKEDELELFNKTCLHLITLRNQFRFGDDLLKDLISSRGYPEEIYNAFIDTMFQQLWYTNNLYGRGKESVVMFKYWLKKIGEYNKARASLQQQNKDTGINLDI